MVAESGQPKIIENETVENSKESFNLIFTILTFRSIQI